jgi:hypothetical protein
VATQNREIESIAAANTTVEIAIDSMHIHELSVEHPAVVAYLQTIDPGKQEIALVHAIEVGITELVARRARARASRAVPQP